MKHDAPSPSRQLTEGSPDGRPHRRGRAGRRRPPVRPRRGPGPAGRAGGRPLRAHAHARSGQPLLDLVHLGAPAHFDPLVDVTNDSKFVPALAESWRAVNNTTWRFTLRKGVTFHDGTPFNADSVLYTLRRVKDNAKLSSPSSTRTSSRWRRTATTRSSVTSKRPFGSLPAHLTMLGMLPPSAAARTRRRSSRSRSGPARSASCRGPTATTSCWRPTRATGSRAVPKVEKVTFRFIPELSTRAAAPARGRDPRDRPRVARHGRRRSRAAAGVKVLDTPALEAQRWIFQLARDPVKDPRVRQGHLAGHRPQRDHQGPAAGLRAAGGQPGPARAHRPHEPAARSRTTPRRPARSSSRPGTRTSSIDFVLMKDLYPKQLEIAQAVAAMLGDVGIKVNIRNLEIATAREQRTRRDLRHVLLGLGPHAARPRLVLRPVVHQGRAPRSSRATPIRRSSSSSPRAGCPIPRCARRSTRRSSGILWEDEPEIWPYYSVAIYAVSDKLRNFEARRDYYVLLYDVGIA